jgi:multimeric flavodoxin WrbA
MKVVSFLGSPRINGNTATLLDSVIKGMRDAGDIHNEQIFLHEKNIKPCAGCNSCKKNDTGMCIVKDDMQEMYKLMGSADYIILATPIYWWTVSAQMKLLIDRIYGMNFKCGSKKIVLLMTYEGELPNSGPETTEKLFYEICEYLKMEAAGVLGVCTGKIEVRNNQSALSNGFEFGKKLIQAK